MLSFSPPPLPRSESTNPIPPDVVQNININNNNSNLKKHSLFLNALSWKKLNNGNSKKNTIVQLNNVENKCNNGKKTNNLNCLNNNNLSNSFKINNKNICNCLQMCRCSEQQISKFNNNSGFGMCLI